MRLGIVSPSFRVGDYSPLMPRRHLKGGEEAFDGRYRLVPGPALPLWPERLAVAALKAVREPLPDAEALSRLQEQVREELERRWRSTASE
jgi:hypothetical protein